MHSSTLTVGKWTVLAQVAEKARQSILLMVGLVLVASLALRLFGLGWGIPHYDRAHISQSLYRSSYHIDEDNLLWGLVQMRPSAGDFDVHDYHWGTLQFYLIYATLLGGEAGGIVPAPWEDAFQRGDVDTLPRLYMLGRLVSVAAGVAGTLIVIALGALLGGRLAGLAAGVVYALAPFAVMEAHYLTNDVSMSVLVAGAVLAAALGVQGGRVGWLAGAGMLMGLAVADKYSALFAAPALLVAQLSLLRSRRFKPRRKLPVLLFLPWLAMLAGFAIGEPYAILSPGKLLDGLQITVRGNGANPALDFGASLNMLGWQSINLAGLGLTWPLAILALGGLLATLRGVLSRGMTGQHERAEQMAPQRAIAAVILTAIGGLVIGLAFNRVFMLRYSQPLVPLLAVAAGVGWAAIPRPSWRWLTAVGAVGVASVITFGQLSILADEHPANQLLTWLQGHLKPGEEVARLWPEYPILDTGPYKLTRIDPWAPDLLVAARPDYIIMDDMALGPVQPHLSGTLAEHYTQVVRFATHPHINDFAWDEGLTPHDWKYSHPTFTVYAHR